MGLKEKLRDYPKVGNITPRPGNTQAKCPCGEVGKFLTEVQYTFMRGEDDVVWTCKAHKRDIGLLTRTASPE